MDVGPSTEVRPTGEGEERSQNAAAPRWSDSRSRYADLLAHLSPGSNGTGQQPAEPPRANDPVRGADPLRGPEALRGPDPLRGQGPLGGGDPLGGQDPLGVDAPRVSDVGERTSELRAGDIAAARFPASAPPYPYEGDLDDVAQREPARPAVIDGRTAIASARPGQSDRLAFPAVRPSTPAGRVTDWGPPESRYAMEQNTPIEGFPKIGQPSAPQPTSAPIGSQSGPVPFQPDPALPDPIQPRQSQAGQSQPGPPDGSAVDPGSEAAAPSRAAYDPSSFPRRLPYEAPQTRSGYEPGDTSGGYPRPGWSGDTSGYARPGSFSGFPNRAAAGEPRSGESRGSRSERAGRSEEPGVRTLPQRVPAEPDVPTVPEPPSVEPPAEAPALARIATHLRRGDVLSSPEEREDGFDVKAILAAVREVAGVRDASLRTTPAGAHSLRLDLSEGADPAEVSRLVARLLQDTMGLDAAAMTGSDVPHTGVPAPRTGSSPLGPAAGGGPLSPGLLSPEALAGSPSAGSAPSGTAYVPSQPVPAGRAPLSGAGSFTAAGPLSNADTQDVPHSPGSVSGAFGAERLPSAGRARASVDAQQGRAVGETSGSIPGSRAPHAGTVERQSADFEPAPPRPLIPGDRPGPRVIIENVQVNTFGIEATVEVRLTAGDRGASGVASGPAVDGYLLRLCATATAGAVDELLAFSDHVEGPARCFVEHAATVPFGASEVAVVVLLLSCGGWVEQLAGSSVVTGDDRHAMVRATLAAVNRRLEALLS